MVKQQQHQQNLFPPSYSQKIQNPLSSSSSSSSSSSLTTAKTSSKFSASSVLAPTFVPASERQINLLPILPGHLIEASSNPSLDSTLQLLNRTLVFPSPCFCNPSTCWDDPKIQKLVPDFRFALLPASSTKTAHGNGFEKEDKKNVTHLKDNIDDNEEEETIEIYFKRYERLLFFEYREMLRLFERYSQYHVQVHVLPHNTQPPFSSSFAAVDESSSISESSFYVAKMYLRGIADARPAIQPNDILLFRPHSFVATSSLSPSLSTTRQNMIEIHSRVISIIRAKDESTRDIVTFTWISPQERMQYLGPMDESYYTFAVRFIPSTCIYERSLTALFWTLHSQQSSSLSLPQSTSPKKTTNNILLDFLFPTQLPLLPSLSSLVASDKKVVVLENIRQDTDYSSLSIKQQQFVQLVLQRTLYTSTSVRPPLMLTGPAGTGKTRTLLAAIRHVLYLNPHPPSLTTTHNKTTYRVLVCTPSHTAADVITQRLSKFYDKTTLFRLYDADRPVSTVPLPILPFTSFSSETGSFTLPTSAVQMLSYRIIICTCTDAHLLYRMGLTNTTLRQRKRCFQNFTSLAMVHNQMTLACCNPPPSNTTTTTLEDHHVNHHNDNNSKCLPTSTRDDISSSILGADELHFTHLFVDEAAQAMEPELLIPLSIILDATSSTGKQAEVILVGDPRQLSPQVFSYNNTNNTSSSSSSSSYHRLNGLLLQQQKQKQQKGFDLSCPMIERFLRRPSPDSSKADLLGPLCDDNLSTLEDLLAYAFQSDKMVRLNGSVVDNLFRKDDESDIVSRSVGSSSSSSSSSSDLSSTTCCIFLTMNYRGHACFLMMPSTLFYDDRLQSKNEGSDSPYIGQNDPNLMNASKNQDYTSVEIAASNSFERGDKRSANYWLDQIRLIESMSSIVLASVMEEIYYFDADVKRYLHDNIVNYQKQMSWPMHFRGVSGKDICDTVESISGSNSWCNHEEAHTVVDIICKMCFEGRASTEDIGVMAPYRSQVVLIRKLLRGKNLGGVNVGTVEDYQGVEKNIIVLSLTRSNLAFVNEDIKQRMGLFQQPMRMNVALTRAENMFVVVGNPHLMAKDRLWKQWLCFCHRNGLWYGESFDVKEMCHLYGKARRQITCHVLRKLPDSDVYQGDKEISASSDDSQSDAPSNPLKYILMSSIERRMRLLELTSVKS